MIKKKIPIISNADLSARNGVQKRGLQARAINALHSVMRFWLSLLLLLLLW